jgi:hypothetical protein
MAEVMTGPKRAARGCPGSLRTLQPFLSALANSTQRDLLVHMLKVEEHAQMSMHDS